MSTIKTAQELYDDFIAELQSQAPALTDTNDGSTIDVIAGVTALAVNELMQLNVDLFRKTFFETANGPEITDGEDELENLAVDHFGSSFERPAAEKATGEVTFSRATTDAGDVTIPVGTTVKTVPDSNGVSQRFVTTAEVVLTGLTRNASIEAVVAGTDGNVDAGTIVVVESSLTDSTVGVTNAAALGDGTDVETDSEYRETIRNLILSLRGATAQAIKSAALAVAGVENAAVVEEIQYVKQWDIAGEMTEGDYFPIPRPKLYIADANGAASVDLIAEVRDAIESVRACGVFIDVLTATALSIDWTATITLNPSGPNYSTLQSDTSMIEDTMRQYIQDLDVGEDFVRADANDAILALWGPSGTDDITAFTTSVPAGNVATNENQKLIVGTITT